jgi:hypothetical protein
MESAGKQREAEGDLRIPPKAPHNNRGDSSESTVNARDEITFAHSDYPYHAEHGPPIDNALRYNEVEEDYSHHNKLLWSRIRHYLREPFMEFMGTVRF